MTSLPEADRVAQEIVDGCERALAKGLTSVERGGEFAQALLERLYPHTGRAHIIGITGNPGSGKSTLTRALAREARSRGLSVGVIAIDPSSPYSGGSILGDRIRMNDVAFEMGVFVRSLATHGALGGLSRAAADSIDLMDAAGREVIFVETVGTGQAEVDVMEVAHTVVVLSVPGLGDEIQSLKAGLLEIADIHVVNKCDREGANRIQTELRNMLAFSAGSNKHWHPPVLSCVAVREEGVSSLLDSILNHFKVLRQSGELDQRCKHMVKSHILTIVRDLLADAAQKECLSDELFQRVVRREMAPHAAGQVLLTKLLNQKEQS